MVDSFNRKVTWDTAHVIFSHRNVFPTFFCDQTPGLFERSETLLLPVRYQHDLTDHASASQ